MPLSGGGGGAAAKLSGTYANAASSADNVIGVTHSQGPVALSLTGANAGDVILDAGPLQVVKNPNGAWFPGSPGGLNGVYQDFIYITGVIAGTINAGNNYTPVLLLAGDNDFHLKMAQSIELEGGDLHIYAGQGSDAAGAAPRHFGGSLRMYSGPQGPNQTDPAGSGNNVCGLVIIDTPQATEDNPATNYPTPLSVTSTGGAVYGDCNIGVCGARSVKIGRLDQGAGGFVELFGQDLTLKCAQNRGIDISTNVNGYGMLVAAGSGDITITAATTAIMQAFGGEAMLEASHFAGTIMKYSTATVTLVAANVKANVPIGAQAVSTASRPTPTAGDAGVQIFNTTTNKPNWWTGSSWVHADGSAA